MSRGLGDVYKRQHQYDGVLCDRAPVISAFIGKRARCRKHLDNRDEAETKEDYPDYLVAFEYVF